jgi:hypothetical protein
LFFKDVSQSSVSGGSLSVLTDFADVDHLCPPVGATSSVAGGAADFATLLDEPLTGLGYEIPASL